MRKDNIKFIQLGDYVTPEMKENKSEAGTWVSWGDDNAFFEYLITLYNNSPTNSACINGTSTIMYGQGLEVVQSDRQLAGYVALKKIFRAKDVLNVCRDFKTFGMAAFEIIFAQTGGKVARAVHVPMNYLRAGVANEEGQIERWFYATDWEQSNEHGFNPLMVPAFGFQKSSDKRAFLVIKPYSFGNYYYSTPDYIGAINWADVESEVSMYHLANLKNGMWPGMLINFNNGIPTETQQDDMEKKIDVKWGGAKKAGRFILAFNRDKESAATIEPIQLSDAAEQFTLISNEATEKLIVGHRVTSPMLLGIKSQTGLGNNADELRSAHALFSNTVVKPMQDSIIEGIDSVLAHNGYSLDLYFKPLTPLEFKSYDIPISPDTREKETGVTLSAEPSSVELSDEIAEDWLHFLSDKGEIIDSEVWDLAYEEEVVPELEAEKLQLFKRFANTSAKSKEGDSGLYKVRYRYSINENPNSRIFCRNMVASSRAGVVYRKEDIDLMSDDKVNIELSPADCKRCGYDIWLHKGGANCHHRWVRQVYFRKRGDDGKFKPASSTDNMENDQRVSVASAEKAGVPKGKLEPKDWKKAETAPINTPTRGYKR